MKKYKTIVVDPPINITDGTKKVGQIGARTISVAESRLNWFDEFYERIEIKDPTFLESILKKMGT